jgi:hypothetical protein
VECKPKIIKEDGCMLLLYKDARVDMSIMDETFGANNWQRTHELINGNLFCNIDVWDDEKKTWVRKQDVGVPSDMESEKGEASDAFKRAGTNVGIGRELYTAPFIWVRLKPGETYSRKDNSNNWYLSKKLKFFVSLISYDENRCINGLVIADQTGEVRYKMGETPAPEINAEESPSMLKDRYISLYEKLSSKLGGRESARDALGMTQDELIKIAKSKNSTDLKKAIAKIEKELDND